MRRDAFALIVCANIRKHRAIAGLSVGQLAWRLRSHHPVVCRVESGLHCPDLVTIYAYADALRVPVSSLIDGIDPAIVRIVAGERRRDALP
jgi:ribosome-binding protein aMBF1 (putative translation factor)